MNRNEFIKTLYDLGFDEESLKELYRLINIDEKAAANFIKSIIKKKKRDGKTVQKK